MEQCRNLPQQRIIQVRLKEVQPLQVKVKDNVVNSKDDKSRNGKLNKVTKGKH